MDQNEIKYTEGFNSGYLLAKYEPALLTKITTTINPNGEYLEGFFAGKEQLEIEQSKTHVQDLTSLRAQAKGRQKDQER